MHRPDGDYAADVAADFRMIAPHLPNRVRSIIDIGCGMAGIDVYLKRRYPHARLTLLDGNGEKPVYGFSARCAPYGNRRAANALLAANGVRADRWLEAGHAGELRADLVISLLSWGFHYPLSAYRVRGRCVADINRSNERTRGDVIWRARHSDRCTWRC